MIKRIFLPAIVVLFFVLMSSCGEESSYMPQIAEMKDSIFKAYPTTVASILIDVDNKTKLNIVLGGEALYKTEADKRQKMANDLGLMAVRIFGKDSYLKTGQLVITKDEKNSLVTPPDGLSVPINIDSLKKVN